MLGESGVEFFSTLRATLEDPNDEVPESVVVTIDIAEGAPHPAALLCLVGQYVLKVGYNLYESPAFEMYWDELCASRGCWNSVGPDHLLLVSERPGRATRTYRGKLYAGESGWIAFTPYEGKGGEGYYATMSAFALIRAIRERLGADAGGLDRLMDFIVDQSGSPEWDVSDSFDGILLVHEAMKELGLADPRQLPGDEDE